MNYLLSFVYLLFTFIMTVVVYKYSGKFGTIIWIVVNLTICNIQTVKTIELFGNLISLGNISYSSIYLATDILNEKYGLKTAQKSVYISFIAIIFFMVSMIITIQFIPAISDTSQIHLEGIFVYLPQITFGSLVAYVVGQLIDTTIYNKLNNIGAKLWVKNNVSTIISQLFDSIIFVVFSYYNLYTFHQMLELIVTMCMFKFLLALLDTPFIYWVRKIKNKYEIE